MGLYKGQILALQKICVHTDQQIRFDILHAKVTDKVKVLVYFEIRLHLTKFLM